jgi:hypothetical protein
MSDTKKTKTKSAPVAKVSVGLQTASIWKNVSEGWTFYNVTFDRRYRDGEGDWNSTDSYGRDDLLALAKLADLAHTKILELQHGEAE